MSYEPVARNRELLNWGLERIKRVPYSVSLRWLFYRFVQEYGLGKKAYNRIKNLTGRVRKAFWGGWTPDTLTDDTRAIHTHGIGYADFESWLKQYLNKKPLFDKNQNQDYVVQVWFEAKAMYQQFLHITKPYCVTLAPFGGDPSIPLKWDIAKRLEWLHEAYGKPIVVLYFGDFDEKGLTIPVNAMEDIKAWCSVPFNFKRCGITKEQVVEWRILEDPGSTGRYQWEALPEDKAEELITENLNDYRDLDKIKEIEDREDEAGERWRGIIRNALEMDASRE